MYTVILTLLYNFHFKKDAMWEFCNQILYVFRKNYMDIKETTTSVRVVERL